MDGFKQLYSWAEELGDPTFPAGVIEGLDGMVEACHSSQNDYGTWQLAATLAERGQEKRLIEQGYVPAIGKALAQAKYAQAKGLALQAERIAPDGAAAVEAAFKDERQKVTSTLGTLRRLCDSLRNNAEYHTGSSWCFPAAAPQAVQSAVDGWGRAVLYSPLQPDQAGACNQGFTLTSLGADGSVTEGNDRSPAGEIICQYLAGWEAWQEPNQYWKADAG